MLLGEAANRQQARADQLAGTAHAQAGEQPQAVAHRRERVHEGVEQRALHVLPPVLQLQPPVAVAGREGVEGAGGGGSVAGEHGGGPAGRRVGEHGRRVHPLQPVALQLEVGEHGGRHAERVERAEAVDDETRLERLRAAHGAAGFVLRFEQQDVPPPIGEQVGRGQAVGAGADDDGIAFLGHR